MLRTTSRIWFLTSDRTRRSLASSTTSASRRRFVSALSRVSRRRFECEAPWLTRACVLSGQYPTIAGEWIGKIAEARPRGQSYHLRTFWQARTRTRSGAPLSAARSVLFCFGMALATLTAGCACKMLVAHKSALVLSAGWLLRRCRCASLSNSRRCASATSSRAVRRSTGSVRAA
jgi:hypothetical protein